MRRVNSIIYAVLGAFTIIHGVANLFFPLILVKEAADRFPYHPGEVRGYKHSAPTERYGWSRNSRIKRCSFSSLMRVNSFVPSLVIVSALSKGILS